MPRPGPGDVGQTRYLGRFRERLTPAPGAGGRVKIFERIPWGMLF